ncbi:hypothetical protein FRC15_006891 [Serendipita sp. 397]|nr:hypothetical protein FRC15_006891 [Serendipita sp. 397]
MASPLCMGCGIKTRRFDTNTGSYFDYCGLHCRNAVRNGNWGASSLNGQTTTAASSSSSFVPQPIRSGQSVQNPSSSNCIAPNCNRPRWYNPQQGDYSLFCSIKCRNANPHLQSQQQPQRHQPQPSHAPAVVGSSLGQRACVICKSAPYDAARESLFCGYACLKKAEAMAPGIIEIPMSHPKFRNSEHTPSHPIPSSPILAILYGRLTKFNFACGIFFLINSRTSIYSKVAPYQCRLPTAETYLHCPTECLSKGVLCSL